MAPFDPLFDAYAQASEAGAPAALERLTDSAQPAIREVCAGALGFDEPELEDACADALMRFINRVQQLRERGGNGIQNVPAYAAVTARRVCADYLRRTHPLRARLGCRVRYALTHDPLLQLRGSGSIRHAGLAGWAETLPAVHSPALAEIAASMRIDVSGTALLNTLRTVLARAGGWVETGTLISVLFDAAALRDPTFTPVEDVEPAAPVAESGTDQRESRSELESAWGEIVLLPLRQRIALLMHLRDDEGRSGLALFVLTGVASIAVLASALGLSPTELADVWRSLPLDDLAIAKRLTATRQQVINLRKSARARLGRRLRGRSAAVVIPRAIGRQMIREHS